MSYTIWPDGIRGEALRDVNDERNRQEEKWGEQNHDPFTYLTVLGEEFGELCQAALHTRFGGPMADQLRKEAVQTAAVALAIIECLDRGKWTFLQDIDNSGNLLALPAGQVPLSRSERATLDGYLLSKTTADPQGDQ